MYDFWGSVCSNCDYCIWINIPINFYKAGLNFSDPIELEMMVSVSMLWPLNCLYYFCVWVSMILKRSDPVTSRYFSKLFFESSATDDIVLRQLSFTRELPWVERWINIYIKLSSWGAACSNFIPSKKFVRQAAACETTLGIGSWRRAIILV